MKGGAIGDDALGCTCDGDMLTVIGTSALVLDLLDAEVEGDGNAGVRTVGAIVAGSADALIFKSFLQFAQLFAACLHTSILLAAKAIVHVTEEIRRGMGFLEIVGTLVEGGEEEERNMEKVVRQVALNEWL